MDTYIHIDTYMKAMQFSRAESHTTSAMVLFIRKHEQAHEYCSGPTFLRFFKMFFSIIWW
jgi:hypothetical protein